MSDKNTYVNIEKQLSELIQEQKSTAHNVRYKTKKSKTHYINVVRNILAKGIICVVWIFRIKMSLLHWMGRIKLSLLQSVAIRIIKVIKPRPTPKSAAETQKNTPTKPQNLPNKRKKIKGKNVYLPILSFFVLVKNKVYKLACSVFKTTVTDMPSTTQSEKVDKKLATKQQGGNGGGFKPFKSIKWGGICALLIGGIYGLVIGLSPVVKSVLNPKFGLGYYEYESQQGGDYQLVTLKPDTEYDNASLNTPFVVDYVIKSGDSLVNILTAYNVGNRTATLNAMNKVFPAGSVAVGQHLKLGIIGGDTPYEMASVVDLKLEVNKEKSVFVTWDKDTDTYTQKIVKRQLKSVIKQQAGDISLSLYVAMSKAGINQPTIVNFINLFSFDTDFQRDIYKGDLFDIQYQEYTDTQGEFAKPGDILVAELSTLGGNRKRYYYYTDSKGKSDYYDHTGKSGRKFLMKTPIEGARLSSSFGNRKHPILGYTKMHRGTDFAAPTGTPIFAAGDGIVERAGRFGSFGIYIRIRHNGQYKTAYAHMKGIARGVRTGTRVKQGQVIGYVGTTGRSTGPHLHYEVIRNGVHVNSRTLKLPSGTQLKSNELAKFKQYIIPYMKDGL